MSEKNFASYGDMETLVTEIVDKCGPYTEISYENWLQLTPYQQEHGRWDVTGVPGADGTISIDLMTKLWENPSPTASFAAQNINVSIDGYTLILVIAGFSNGDLSIQGFIGEVGRNVIISFGLPSASGSRTCSRFASLTSNSKIVFLDAKDTIGTTAASTNNNRCIPITIYGIKLHHTVEIKAIAPTVSTLAEKCVFDPTDTGLESTDVEAAIKELETNFQAGVDDIYDAVVAKGSTPASHSLSDVVTGIGNIPTGITPSGTKSITANGTDIDVTEYAKVDVAVPNTNSGTYTASSRSSALDMGATNSYRYVNTNGVPKGTAAYYNLPVNRVILSQNGTTSFTVTSGRVYTIVGQNYKAGTQSYVGYVNASGTLTTIASSSYISITKSGSTFTIKSTDTDRFIFTVFCVYVA